MNMCSIEAAVASDPHVLMWASTRTMTLIQSSPAVIVFICLKTGVIFHVHSFASWLSDLRVGLLLLLQSCLRIKPGGLAFFGIPCSTHVWVASGVTKKSKSNPRGDTSLKACRTGNQIASRSALAILVSVARGVHWAVEQPGSSVLPYLREYLWVSRPPSAFADYCREAVTVRLKLGRTHVLHRSVIGCAVVGFDLLGL